MEWLAEVVLIDVALLSGSGGGQANRFCGSPRERAFGRYGARRAQPPPRVDILVC
jgi:hypothetical protein